MSARVVELELDGRLVDRLMGSDLGFVVEILVQHVVVRHDFLLRLHRSVQSRLMHGMLVHVNWLDVVLVVVGVIKLVMSLVARDGSIVVGWLNARDKVRFLVERDLVNWCLDMSCLVRSHFRHHFVV